MAARKRNGRLERVDSCIYRRNGVYVVTMADGRGGKLWRGGIGSLEEARDVRAELRQQKRALKKKRGPETIKSFAGRWTTDFPRSENTNLNNEQVVRVFVREFGDLRLSDFTGEMASKFAVAHPSTAIRIKTMFGDAVRTGADGLRENPFDGIVIPKSRGRQDITALTKQELDTLLAIAAEVHGPEYGPQYSALIEVAAFEGMRPGELFALSWHDIDFEEQVIRVDWARQDKTGKVARPKATKRYPKGKRREIALTEPAERALRRLQRLDAPSPVVNRPSGPDGHPAPLVFASKRGLPFTHRNHFHYWDPVRRAFYAQLPESRKPVITPDLDLYELRHFCGSYLADQGASPYDIAQHMGHEDGGQLAMRTYIHVGEAASRERIRAIFRRERPDEGREATG